MGRKRHDEPSDTIRLPRSIVVKIRRLALEAKLDTAAYFKREFGPLVDEKHRAMLTLVTATPAGPLTVTEKAGALTVEKVSGNLH